MPGTSVKRPRPSLHLTAGPLAAETELLRDLEASLPTGEEAHLRSLLIVVPSRSLRDHLQARIVEHIGRAIVGVRVATLFGLALEITEDAAGRLLAGGDLFPLFARRLAREEKDLHRVLHHLNDGYSALIGAVRDLLDAGLDPAHADALLETLAEEGPGVASRREVARAQALVRVASGALTALAGVGAGRRSTLLAAAAERVRQRAPDSRSPGAVWIYGFADASGVATDLITALLDRLGGSLYLDQPPDPSDPESPDAGIVFTRRFRERIETMATDLHEGKPTAPPHFEVFRALGSDAEVREVGLRIRNLLDAGVVPERIAVVARQLPPYERAIRTQFHSLGIGFSTYGSQISKSRAGRRAEAVADLLQLDARTPIERWLEARRGRFADRPHYDLRSAFATLGLGRLQEVAALLGDNFRISRDLSLDARHGFASTGADDEDAQGGRLVRRTVPAKALRAAVEGADALVSLFDRWQRAGSVEAHLRLFADLLTEHLGWEPDAPMIEAVRRVWEALAEDDALSFEEFVEGAIARLREIGQVPLGGEGGGVQVLDVIEARARTCERLFVLGLNRGSFPRVVREDPILPDSLRGVLSRQGFGVLPDLVDKRTGFDEERFLFAQLLASSPHVTLSWQDTDDDQAPLAPSPLLERLRWTGGDPAWQAPLLARPVVAQTVSVPRSPYENAIATALYGPRARLREVLALVLPGSLELVAARAAARMAVLDELDPSWTTEHGRAVSRSLGPYFGAVGSIAGDDPRGRQRLYVTTLERLAGCPWQAFLERVLRLAPVPDPLAALPGITPRLIGALTHSVLEAIVRRALPDDLGDLEQARHRLPQAVRWPEDRELEQLVQREALGVCRRQGIAVDGFGTVLARAVNRFLDQARRLDWPSSGTVHALGVELEGRLTVPDFAGHQRTIHFRADRLDLGPEGFVATDYKTGARPVSTATTRKSRRDRLAADVRNGARLQAVAYALAGGTEPDIGRYLFLHPNLSEERSIRDVRIQSGDSEIAEAFERAVAAAIATWDAGTFFPRLVEPDEDKEPFRCSVCEVRDACMRSDSGARRRLRGWMDRRHTEASAGADLSTSDLILLTSWRLGAREPSR